MHPLLRFNLPFLHNAIACVSHLARHVRDCSHREVRPSHRRGRTAYLLDAIGRRLQSDKKQTDGPDHVLKNRALHPHERTHSRSQHYPRPRPQQRFYRRMQPGLWLHGEAFVRKQSFPLKHMNGFVFMRLALLFICSQVFHCSTPASTSSIPSSARLCQQYVSYSPRTISYEFKIIQPIDS